MANLLKDDSCQGTGCSSRTNVTFCKTENQRLCPECADINRHSIVDQDWERKKWACPEHGQGIEFYCKTHSAIACQSCASISHQPPCMLADVRSHVRVEQARFGVILSELETMERDLGKYMETVHSHSAYAAQLLRGIETYILDAFREEMERVKEDLAWRDNLAKHEAALEINKINEQLDFRLTENEKEANGKLLSIKIETDLLLSKLKQSIRAVAVIPNRMQMISHQKSSAVSGMKKKINELIGNEEQLLAEGHLADVVEKTLQTDLDTSILETLDKIVERISFSRKDGTAVGTLTDTEGVWELVGKIDVSTIRVPLLVGHVGTKSVVIADIMNKTLYNVSIKSKEAETLIQSGNLGCISDCSSLNENTFVCGNYANGSVCFFSSSWKHLREIRLQEHPTSSGDPVYLDIDRDGRIVAILYGQPVIYIIDPTLEVRQTITLAHCKTVLDIHTLSSGDILVQSGLNRFTVFDTNFEEKKVIHRAHWESATCVVDKSTNLVYVTFKEVGKASFAIDVLCPEGEVFEERCVVFPVPYRADSTPRCQCVEHGKLVVCSGNQLLMYKKALGVDDIKILEQFFSYPDDELLPVTFQNINSLTRKIVV